MATGILLCVSKLSSDKVIYDQFATRQRCSPRGYGVGLEAKCL